MLSITKSSGCISTKSPVSFFFNYPFFFLCILCALSGNPFMANEPNFKKRKFATSCYFTRSYKKTKPIRSQYEANSNSGKNGGVAATLIMENKPNFKNQRFATNAYL